MKLIVALGNVGDTYAKSRHNVGWMIIDQMLGDVDWNKDKYANAHIYRDGDTMYVKPLTMMNNSGSSVHYLVKQFDIPTEDIIVIRDDIDMAMGKVRTVSNSGHGGHNGVRSITNHLGSNAFTQIKIGISPVDNSGQVRKPTGGWFTSKKTAVSKFVLGDFSAADQSRIKEMAHEIEQNL